MSKILLFKKIKWNKEIRYWLNEMIDWFIKIDLMKIINWLIIYNDWFHWLVIKININVFEKKTLNAILLIILQLQVLSLINVNLKLLWDNL